MDKRIGDLPNALGSLSAIAERLSGRRPAVFLDYDGTLTPIVDRPEDAILTDAMRATVRDLAERCLVAIVSGRDRPDVQALVGLDNLFYAGSHGFDIAGPHGAEIQHEVGAEYYGLLQTLEDALRAEMAGVEGAIVEHKKVSFAVHYRLVSEAQRADVRAAVDRALADHPDLQVKPGKMVWEVQPRLDWHKGKAVLYLLDALDLAGDDVLPLYFGDDHTDEDAFRALAARGPGRGLGIFVGRDDDPEVAGRVTAADFKVPTPDDAGRLLDRLAR
ncbi:MAG: trehalose-phosphatase [Rhodobacterales bacterium]|nr:trehalose-phosphatase [Rhodobacterales bacterium]